MVGTAIDSLVLPEAAGGEAPITYSVSTLPAGLSFDTATRTLTGTPTTATTGAVNIIYTVIDSTRDASALIFAITVNEGAVAPATADGQITATPSAVREDAGTTQVSLRVTLTAARATDEVVTFTLVAPSEGSAGRARCGLYGHTGGARYHSGWFYLGDDDPRSHPH